MYCSDISTYESYSISTLNANQPLSYNVHVLCVHLSSLILSLLYLCRFSFQKNVFNTNPSSIPFHNYYYNVLRPSNLQVLKISSPIPTLVLIWDHNPWHTPDRKMSNFLLIWLIRKLGFSLAKYYSNTYDVTVYNDPLFCTVLSHSKSSVLISSVGQHSPHRGSAQHLHRYRVHWRIDGVWG